MLARLDVRLDVGEPARGLTLAEQQTVEIAKAISLDVRVLIMDEPTASLSAHEVRQLFRIVTSLRRRGRGDPLHLPPHGGGLRDRRPRDDPARRPLDLDHAARRADAGGGDPRHGRAQGRRALPARASRPGRGAARRARPAPRGRLSGRLLRAARGRGARVRRAGRGAPHRRRAGALRDRAGGRRRDRARRRRRSRSPTRGRRCGWGSPTAPRTGASSGW